MEGYTLVDAHVHSKEISKCSRVSGKEIVDTKIKEGYGGMVLTNHCQSWYYEPKDHIRFVRSLLGDWYSTNVYARKFDFKVFLGIEVTITKPAYRDFLLYGITEEFLMKSPCLYNLSQEELYKYCNGFGHVAMIQAHPFREGIVLGDPKFMHGLEINCSPIDLDKADLVLKEAKKNGLRVTCGTDYHGILRPVNGGIYLPESISSAEEMGKYLLSTDATYLRFNGDIKITRWI